MKYNKLFYEEYADVVRTKNRNQKTEFRITVKRFINQFLRQYLQITDYELWMMCKLAYSNDGIQQEFIDPLYNKKFQIINFYTEEDGLQFYLIQSKISKDLIIAFRGTDEWVDWLTNIQIKEKKRQFESAKTHLENIVLTYFDYRIYFCGHSLGGALAQEMFVHFQTFQKLKLIKAVTFNSAGVRNKKGNPYRNLQIVNYVVENDWVGNKTGLHYGETIRVECLNTSSKFNIIKLYTHGLNQFCFDSNGNILNRVETFDEEQVS